MGPFPSGNDVRVTEAQAKVACANIADADLRADCMTDVRMVNDPDVTDKLVDGFKTVEATDKLLKPDPAKCQQCAKTYAQLGMCRYLDENQDCKDHDLVFKRKEMLGCEPCAAAAMDYCKTYKPPVQPVKTCKSVGDPHVYPFEKTRFDTHRPGWVTLYKKGKLIIDAEQKVWASNNQGVAINRAVRYSTDGGVKFTTLQNGQKGDVDFAGHSVKLTVRVQDYSSRRNINADCKFIYDLFVTTNNYAGASGQCVEGKLATDKGDQLPFPSGNDVRVTEAQAKMACANIADADLRSDCMTDVRMVNDPDVTDKLVDGFKTVEATDKVLGHVPVKPVKTCKSVGDPHVYPFEKTRFDTHLPGWVTLYKKGKLIIDAEQKVWASNNQGVAINRAVRYSTD